MVKDFRMAEFMDDQVVLQMFRQKDNTVVEVKIFVARATSPSRFLIFNRHHTKRALVVFVENTELLENEEFGFPFVFVEVAFVGFGYLENVGTFVFGDGFFYPAAFGSHKYSNSLVRDKGRLRDEDTRVRTNRDSQTSRARTLLDFKRDAVEHGTIIYCFIRGGAC